MILATAASENLTAAALVIVAITGLFAAWNNRQTRREVKAIAANVETVNGRSVGTLAELNEGRRVRREIPRKDRTDREQSYVELLEKVEREGSAHEVDEDRQLTERGEPTQGPPTVES